MQLCQTLKPFLVGEGIRSANGTSSEPAYGFARSGRMANVCSAPPLVRLIQLHIDLSKTMLCGVVGTELSTNR